MGEEEAGAGLTITRRVMGILLDLRYKLCLGLSHARYQALSVKEAVVPAWTGASVATVYRLRRICLDLRPSTGLVLWIQHDPELAPSATHCFRGSRQKSWHARRIAYRSSLQYHTVFQFVGFVTDHRLSRLLALPDSAAMFT